MKAVLFLPLLAIFICCDRKPGSDQSHDDANLTDKVITLAIQTRTGEAIELPQLYPHAVNYIAPDNDQNLILADRLALRGFKKIRSGRVDQQLSGRRTFVVTMAKDDCICEVSKIYYSTANVSQYIVSEGIACSATGG